MYDSEYRGNVRSLTKRMKRSTLSSNFNARKMPCLFAWLVIKSRINRVDAVDFVQHRGTFGRIERPPDFQLADVAMAKKSP